MSAALARAAMAGSRRRVAPVPRFVMGLRNRNAAGTSNVVGVLAGVRPGDILVAFAGNSGSGASAPTPPAGVGWTQLADSGNSTGGEVGRMWIFVTTATSYNQDAGTWAWSGTTAGHVVEVVAYRKVVLPTAASIAKSAGGVNPTLTIPSRTTLANGAIAVYGGFWASGGGNPTWSGSMTNRVNNTSAATDGQVMDEPRPTAGATGTRTLSVTNGSAGPLSAGVVILEAA